MIFDDVLGHAHARGVLGRMLVSGRVPHALLFHGPEGVGKRLVAMRFATSLLCDTPRADASACGNCPACTKADHGNHPDLLVVTRLPKVESKPAADTPDEDDEGDVRSEGKSGDLRKWIIVDQIRTLTEHAAFGPREAKRRVFVVDPADRMNAEAQNALLKTLEEPPSRTILVLVASRPHALLPTVRSRCFQLGFAALPPDRLAEGLVRRGLTAAEAASRAALAEGCPGRAMSLDLDSLARRRDAILTALTALTGTPRAAAELGSAVDAVLGDDEAAMLEGLDLVGALLRDAARSAVGQPTILHADVADRISRLGSALGAPRAAELVILSDRLRADLRLNVNATLLAETLLAAVAGGPVPA